MKIECDKLSTAYHEAGHLVAAHKFGEAEYAELLDDVENCGRTEYKHQLNEIEPEFCVLMLLSGPFAGLRYRKTKAKNLTIEEVKSNDFHKAKQVLGWNPIFDSEEKYLEQLIPYQERSETLVINNWKTIESAAALLLKTEKVTSADLDKMV